MADKDKGTVELEPNAGYAQRIKQAKASGTPVGGAPMPAMPRFDRPPPDRHAGVQAASQRAAMTGSGILTAEQAAELQQQGKFIPGVGAGYAANQPAASRIVSGEEAGWKNPPRPEGGLRPETKEQLEAVAKANSEEEKKKEEEEEIFDGPEFDEYNNTIRNLQSNKKRRKAIELRCEEMNLEDLLIHQEVRQRVPIAPNKFEPTFRSPTAAENLWVTKTLGVERGSEVYMQDKLSVMNLTCGLFAINNSELPTHLNKDGEIDEKLFNEKMKKIMRFPLSIIADLSINYTWFGERVSKLSVIDQIKGF